MELTISFKLDKLTKKEVVSNLMYELFFKESVDFEVDGVGSYVAHKTENGYKLEGSIQNGNTHIPYTLEVTSKNDLRTAIRKLGNEIIQL